MGGSAYIIPGVLSRERLAAADTPPSLLKRLLRGGSRASGGRVTTLGGGDTLYEIDAGALSTHLVHDFREWLRSRLPSPSQGTQVPLQYVMDIKPAVYVRGLQHSGEDAPQYNVQLLFSGCAGEAETSARVAAHWAGLWYRAEHERIANAFLRPFGFDPAPYDVARDEPFAFLPAGDLGYLELVSADDAGADAPGFELDYAIATAHEGDERLDRLNALYAHYMRSGKCRCQLCEPDFGDARVEI
jgi:hypothetical protein